MKSDRTMPTKDGRQFQALAEEFGFKLAGLNSSGHAVWSHPDFGDFTTASTPNSGRAWQAARRDLYRMVGLRMPANKRNRPEPRTALTRLSTQARERGHSVTHEQARQLLVKHDGDLSAASAELGELCDGWDARAKRSKPRRRRSVRSQTPRTPSRVDPDAWPVVRMRIMVKMREELDSRRRANARHLAHQMRDTLGSRRCLQLARRAAA